VISGIGKVDEDEFALNLFNEQAMWSSVILATDNSVSTKKRFLSRTARYSGLLNVLDFATVSSFEDTSEELTSTLVDANSWIAFNVSQQAIPALSQAALTAGIKRVIFTTELPAHRINETTIPEFTAATVAFEAVGAAFTGIRHAPVIEGNEDHAYEIVNATVPCMEDTVERGVLARVVAELLLIDKSVNKECGVSSSSQFAAAYLDVLRSSGLTRQQEVSKMFTGGLQRVARLTVDEYELQRQKNERIQAERDQKKIDDEMELERQKVYLALPTGETEAAQVVDSTPDIYKMPVKAKTQDDVDEEAEKEKNILVETDDQKLDKRTKEILQTVWQEYDTRMMAKSTSKLDFFATNKAMAMDLAVRESEDELLANYELSIQQKETDLLFNAMQDVNRKQYAKLMSLERKEIVNQKEISETWVKFIYLLIETTLSHCKETDKLFHNLDEYSQTLLLRSQANLLRAQCNLPAYEVIYDPLDASVIVSKLGGGALGQQLGFSRSGDEIGTELDAKHGQSMKNIAALRGASQIIGLAIATLKKELPVPPPSVNELRRAESAAKGALVSEGRLEGIKNRGRPKSEEEDTVGRM